MDQCNLPYDVLHRVIECVECLPTLFALTQVCREIKADVEPLLWQYLSVRFQDKRSMARCNGVIDDPRGRYIRELRLSFDRLVVGMGSIAPERTQLIHAAFNTMERLLKSTPNVQTLYLIPTGLVDSELATLFDIFCQVGILSKLRVAFVEQAACQNHAQTMQRLWRTHPTIRATHIRAIHRFPYEGRPILRPLPPPFPACCPQCPPGELFQDGVLVPSITADNVEDLRPLLSAASIAHLSTPPEYACLTFGTWKSSNNAIIQGMPQLKTLHLTGGSLGDDMTQPENILEAVSTLTLLEDFTWTGRVTPVVQTLFFDRYESGTLPASLRRVCFVWSEAHKHHRQVYEKTESSSKSWSLVLDEVERRMRWSFRKMAVPVITGRHAEL